MLTWELTRYGLIIVKYRAITDFLFKFVNILKILKSLKYQCHCQMSSSPTKLTFVENTFKQLANHTPVANHITLRNLLNKVIIFGVV